MSSKPGLGAVRIDRVRASRGGGKYYIQARALAGAVYISASDNSSLKDATNREAGIIESDQFVEFQAFVREQIELLNESLERETKIRVAEAKAADRQERPRHDSQLSQSGISILDVPA